MIYVFLAPGFEEIEALTPVDILRRAKLDVCMVGIGDDVIIGSHGIPVPCESEITQTLFDDMEMAILPGGMPGTLNLEKNEKLKAVVEYSMKSDIPIGAICAAPSILGHMGYLKDRKATCYTGFEDQLDCMEYTDNEVVTDGNITTSRGMGTAIPFSLRLLEILKGKESAKKMAESIIWNWTEEI